jgi:hypothetical protein
MACRRGRRVGLVVVECQTGVRKNRICFRDMQASLKFNACVKIRQKRRMRVGGIRHGSFASGVAGESGVGAMQASCVRQSSSRTGSRNTKLGDVLLFSPQYRSRWSARKMEVRSLQSKVQ